MRLTIILLLSTLISACAQLPELKPPTDRDNSGESVPTWLGDDLISKGPTKIKLCEVSEAQSKCATDSPGLSAKGLGGFFLPLNVSVPEMDVLSGKADIKITINGVDANCTRGTVNTNVKDSSLDITQIYCNWIVIGNVVSKLRLTIDWDHPQRQAFGGRYVVTFIGTGNGGGSGLYAAEVQA